MRKLCRLLLILLLPAAPLAAQQPLPGDIAAATDVRALPFHLIAERVAERYAGRMVAARSDSPRPLEHALGARLVYEFRLVTPQRNLLIIRVDAGSGRFLDISGRGQLLALRAATRQAAEGRDRDESEDED